jgi:hypothetical protein
MTWQGVEQELIQFRATGPVVPLFLVSGACVHQADKNITSFAMSHAAFAAVPELTPWARALADGRLRDELLARFEFDAIVDTDASPWAVRFVDAATSASGCAELPRRPRRTAEQILREECTGRTHVGMWRVDRR